MDGMDPYIGQLPELPAGYKYVPCRYCDRPMIVRVVRKRAAAHIECSLKVQADAITQIQNKEGPHYQHWLQGQREALDRLTRESPPDTE